VLAVLASLTDVAKDYGIVALFALIAVETMGIPLPGETALIAAGIFASQGHLAIEAVIVAAATAAILGDNVGFFIGRRYGRRVLESDRGPFAHHRQKLLEVGEPFFAKHGPKAVFLGRWVVGLRIAAAWLAGANRMPWRVFAFWNALGALAWATSVGMLAYALGPTAEGVFEQVGVAGLAIATLTAACYLLWRRSRHAYRARAGSTSAVRLRVARAPR
jgi:membrane-associated protein